MTPEANAVDPAGRKATPDAGHPGSDPATPDYLIPTMGDIQLSEPAYYRSLFVLDTIGEGSGGLHELDKPIDPFAVTDDSEQMGLKPAVGVLTVHEQCWHQKGIALGNLLQSVCLAPGEVTQVAVTRWERKTKGTSAESTEQQEAVSEQAEQNRAVNEVQRAVAQEAQIGQSSTSSHSTSAQAGGSWFFASASAASTTSSAITAQFSAGSRNLAAESTNAIAQRTAEVSQSLRSRRQSVVREVSEQEAESLSTRVLANYNRRHSLNILFFEVLQTYEIKTVLTNWDRCLFVPLLPIDFAVPGEIEKFGAQLLSIFNEIGAKDMLDILEKTLEQAKGANDKIDPRIEELKKRIEELRSDRQRLHDIKFDFAHDLAHMDQNERKARVEKLKTDPEYIALRRKYVDVLPQKDINDIMNPHYGRLDPLIAAAENELASMKVQTKIPAGERLNLHRLFLSQQLWLRMSPYHIYCLLRGYMIENQALSALVDPQPVGVFGNYLAFRWGFPNTDEGQAARESFEKKYLKRENSGQSRVVGLPTSGVFSEAVLGQGLAAEQIDERFGKWGDKENMIPILPPKIADLQSRDRAKGMDLKGQDFAASLAQLRAEKLSDVSYLDKVLGQVGKGDMFRDMGGLAQAVTLADKLAGLSAEGATKAGDRAVQLQSKILDTFEKVIESDVGQAAVAEFMLPGAGPAVLGAMDRKSPQPEKSK